MGVETLSVLYQDNHLLALDKPPGLLSQADQGGSQDILSLAKEWIRTTNNKKGNVYLGLVHRLDRNVGGVILLAKTSKAAARLSKEFREQKVIKDYLAVVERSPEKSRGMLIDWIRKDAKKNKAFPSSPQEPSSRKASLIYLIPKDQELLGDIRVQSPALTPLHPVLVKIRLYSGRFHQIRFQFAIRNSPILGDQKYGSRAAIHGVRLALHCQKISICHPVKKERLSLESPLPDSWKGSPPQ